MLYGLQRPAKCSQSPHSIPLTLRMKAEDSQPNETRAIPKGGRVPTIRTAAPSKPLLTTPFRSHSRNIYTRPQKSRQNRDSNSGKTHPRDPKPYVSKASGSRIVEPGIGSERQAGNKGGHQHNQHRTRGERDPYVPFQRAAPPVRGLRNGYQDSRKNEQDRLVNLINPKKRKVDRYEDSGRETHNIIYDVPENCRGESKGAWNRRRIFIGESLRDIERRFGARIHSHRVNDDKLAIVYSYADFEASGHQASYGDEKSNSTYPDLDLKSKRIAYPSGSNITLEAMVDRSTVQPTVERHEEISAQTLIKPHTSHRRAVASLHSSPTSTTINMNSIPYRTFRSGTLSVEVANVHTNRSLQPATSGPCTKKVCILNETSSDRCKISEDMPDGGLPVQLDPRPLRKSENHDPAITNLIDLRSPSPESNSSHDMHITESPVEFGSGLDFVPCIRVDEASEEYAVRPHRDERDKPRRLLFSSRQGSSYLVCKHATVHEVSQTSPR